MFVCVGILFNNKYDLVEILVKLFYFLKILFVYIF